MLQLCRCVTRSGMADKFTVMTSSSPLPSPAAKSGNANCRGNLGCIAIPDACQVVTAMNDAELLLHRLGLVRLGGMAAAQKHQGPDSQRTLLPIDGSLLRRKLRKHPGQPGLESSESSMNLPSSCDFCAAAGPSPHLGQVRLSHPIQGRQ